MFIRLQPYRVALGVLLFVWSASAHCASILVNPEPAHAIVFVQAQLMPGDETRVFEVPVPKSANSVGVSREHKNQELARRAQFFVHAVTTKWSGTHHGEPPGLDALYAAKVDYYGRRLSRNAVLADKRRFTKRWPERNYNIQSSYAECSSSECFVEGRVEWETRSRTRRAVASGVAGFSYVLVPSGGTFVIKGEDANVLQRRTQTPSQPGAMVEAQSDERRLAQLGPSVAREAQPDERKQSAQPGSTAAREAQSDERLPAQLKPTVARETQPDEWEAVRRRGLSLTAFVELLHAVDLRIVFAAVILVGLLLWRVVNWEWRKSDTKAEAQIKRRAEQEAEKQREAKQNHPSPGGGDPGDMPGPTGPRITPETQQRDAEKEQQEAERRRQAQNKRRRRQTEQEREAERERQWEREHATEGQRDEWWTVLEVAPVASKDEIVRSYRRKIQRCHPDRVSGLAPEFVSLAESRTKALNGAYAEAMRACHGPEAHP